MLIIQGEKEIHVTSALSVLNLKIFNIMYSRVRIYEAYGTFLPFVINKKRYVCGKMHSI